MNGTQHELPECTVPTEPTGPTGTVRPNPRGIVTPRNHGDILITPSLDALAEAMAYPLRTFAGDWLGVPGAAMRETARRDVWQALCTHAGVLGLAAPGEAMRDRPWVVTGHQLEFYHPGVWAKVVAVDALARRCAALAVDLLVDHDVLEHLGFDVPVKDGTGAPGKDLVAWSADVPATAVENISAPDEKAFAAWRGDLCNHPGVCTDAMSAFFTGLRGTNGGSYRDWLSRGRGGLERRLGLDVWHVPFSHVARGRAFRQFVAGWMRNAQDWSQVYNDCLAEYRRAAGIKNASQPMPDLTRSATQIELPFWIYQPGEPRSRLVVRVGKDWTIFHDNKRIDLSAVLNAGGWAAADALGDLLEKHDLALRPRALTLTMFVRLFVSDLFIHGIGGALYDQITDAWMDRQLHVIPPYGCVSAAWLLPLGDHRPPTEDLAALRWRRHHLQHNPALLAGATGADGDGAEPNGAIQTLLHERAALVAAISESLKNSRKDPVARCQRKLDFRQLHALNARLVAMLGGPLLEIDNRVAAAERLIKDQKVINNREWFFPLHSMASLREFIGRVGARPADAPLVAD